MSSVMSIFPVPSTGGVKRSSCVLLLLACALFPVMFVSVVSAQGPTVPALKTYATDLTGTLSWDQVESLNQKLQQFDDSTSNQLVILMIPTLGSSSLEEFSLKVAEANRVGRKGKDNGILLLIVKNDRRIRIEVGRGLEGALPDALAGIIIRREIGPRFSEGNFYGGIDAGVGAIILATRNEYKAEPGGRKHTAGNILPILVVLFVMFMILRMSFRRGGGIGGPRSRSWGGFPPIGGGWGGGGFGGSGGGFSGGGGSFSGGGASGSW